MELVELGTILEMVKGKKPVNQSAEKKDGYFPYVDIEAFETGIIKQYTDGEKCTPCDDGDILIVCDGSRSGLVGRAVKGYVGSTLAKISAKGLNDNYFFHFVQGKYALLNTKKKGTGTPHLNPELLKQQKLIVPPLPEQERIVSRIEELFSQLDAGVETLKKTKAQLAVYRQAVLKEAFEGIDGEKKTVDDVCNDIKVGIVIKPAQYYTTPELGIKAFRSANVREFHIDDFDWVYLSKEGQDKNSRTIVHTDDVLIVRSGYPGTACVVTKDFDGCNAIDVLIAVPDKDIVLPEYLCAFTNSPLGKSFVAEKKRGVGQKHFNVNGYKKMPITVPSLEEQQKIVENISERLSVCDSINQTVDTSLQQAGAMRQSILIDAFEGRL